MVFSVEHEQRCCIAKSQNKPFSFFPIISLHFSVLLLELLNSFRFLPRMSGEYNTSGGCCLVPVVSIAEGVYLQLPLTSPEWSPEEREAFA